MGPFLAVLLVGEPEEKVEEQIDVGLACHVERAENGEAGVALQFFQVLLPELALLAVCPVLHAPGEHAYQLLKPFFLLECLENCLLRHKGANSWDLLDQGLNCGAFEQLPRLQFQSNKWQLL